MKRTIRQNRAGQWSVTVTAPASTKSCKGLPTREAAERLAKKYESDILEGI